MSGLLADKDVIAAVILSRLEVMFVISSCLTGAALWRTRRSSLTRTLQIVDHRTYCGRVQQMRDVTVRSGTYSKDWVEMGNLVEVHDVEGVTCRDGDAHRLLPRHRLLRRERRVQLDSRCAGEGSCHEQLAHVFGATVADGCELAVVPFDEGVQGAEPSEVLVTVRHVCGRECHRRAKYQRATMLTGAILRGDVYGAIL